MVTSSTYFLHLRFSYNFKFYLFRINILLNPKIIYNLSFKLVVEVVSHILYPYTDVFCRGNLKNSYQIFWISKSYFTLYSIMDKRHNPSSAGQKRPRSQSPCINEKFLTTARSLSSTTQVPSIDFSTFDVVACAQLTKEFSSLSSVKRRISKDMKATYQPNENQDAVRLHILLN